jgi:hypothetical protein
MRDLRNVYINLVGKLREKEQTRYWATGNVTKHYILQLFFKMEVMNLLNYLIMTEFYIGIVTCMGGTRDENNGFEFGWLDLLAIRLHYFSYLQSIQRYRWFTQFTVHHCTHTRIPSLH